MNQLQERTLALRHFLDICLPVPKSKFCLVSAKAEVA